MPTTNDKRLIKITANSGNVTASTFDVDFDAAFDSPQSLALSFSDSSSGSCDKTLRELVVSDAATGSEIGRTSILFKVDTVELGEFSAGIDRSGRSDTTPPPSGTPHQVRNPTASNFRRWAQVVKQSGENVLRNFANVDAKSAASSGAVDQSVVTNDDTTFALRVTFSDRGGSALASGTVTVTTSAKAGDGFTLGPVRLSESEDDGEVERTVIRR
ncbi:MAG: hypothetical protein KC486_22325 [Myxococcales bacterium]|nr:hypothetical protein [Myxococcales bacterium]MCA9661094.1 hypothetical protein [Myxococcales bacterium]MCB9568898.1 hypothetical protein [Myxococcales bacterium]